jgi:hypothetical protein
VSSPLRDPRFRLLWTAGLISETGDWLLLVSLPILVYQLTCSALGTAVAFLVELAPGVLLSPLAGLVADRCSRTRWAWCPSSTHRACSTSSRAPSRPAG